MPDRKRKPDIPAEKTLLHPRNPHRFRYDFPALVSACPDLAPFVSVNPYGNESVDFSDPAAVKALNRAILSLFYGIAHWDIPEGYLCPPIPGRADYIHYAADLLASRGGGRIPEGQSVSVLDIGVGANCVYPIIGCRSYGWHFTGSDTDPVSVASAEKIIRENANLSGLVDIRLQGGSDRIFRGIIGKNDFFDLTVCNPPFHESASEAAAGTARKLRNLGNAARGARQAQDARQEHAAQPDQTRQAAQTPGNPVRNFGGRNGELWCPGGEAAFIRTMIGESALFADKCLWFTTLVSKRENLGGVLSALKRIGVAEVRTIDMAQGQKTSRFVAWTFLDEVEGRDWAARRWK